jgi:beta-glucosidase-like glycosyl hydrolase
MTLRQEVGAVLMVGFRGGLTPAVLDDWRSRQFGGLMLTTANGNPLDAGQVRSLIGSVRAVMQHPLLAAAAQQQDPATLKSEGFDIALSPVDGPDAPAAISRLHAAGMYAVVTDGTGNADAAVRVALGAHVDLVLLMDALISDSLQRLRSDIGFQGPVLCDGACAGTPQTPATAVAFLESGGDMAIVSPDMDVADATYDAIYAAVVRGEYPRDELDASVQRLLKLSLRYMP